MKFYNNRLYDRHIKSKRVKDDDPDDYCWPELVGLCFDDFENAIDIVEKASLKHSVDFKTNPGHQMLSEEEWEAIDNIDYYTAARAVFNATFVETVKAYPELGKRYISILKKLQSKHWDWIEDGYDSPIDYDRLVNRTYDIMNGIEKSAGRKLEKDSRRVGRTRGRNSFANDRRSHTRRVKDVYAHIGYDEFRRMLEGVCELLEPYVRANPITVTGLDRSEEFKSGKYAHIMSDLENASSQLQYLFNDLDTIDSTERLVSDLLEAEPDGVRKLTKLKLDHLRVRDDGENGYADENEYEDENGEEDEGEDNAGYVKIGRTAYENYVRNAYKRASDPTFHSSGINATCVDLIMDLRGMLIALIKAWNENSSTWQIGNRNYYKYVADEADEVNDALSYMKRRLDEFIRIFKDAASLYTPSQVPEGFARTAKRNANKYKKEAGGGFDPALYQAENSANLGRDDDDSHRSNDPLIPDEDTPEGYAERNEQDKASLQDGMKQVNEVMSAGNPKKAYEVLAASKAEENSIGVEEFLRKYPWDKFYEYISDTTAYKYTKEQFEFDKQNPPVSYDEGAFRSDKAKAFRAIDNDSSYSSELQTWLENAPDIRSFVFWFYNEFGKTPLDSTGSDVDFRAAAKRYKANYRKSSGDYNFASFLTDWIYAYDVDRNFETDDGDELDEALESLLQEAQTACNYINGASSGN